MSEWSQTNRWTFGATTGDTAARDLVQRFRGEGNDLRALEGVWHYWSQTLGKVYVETPDQTVNFLANGWLIYQTLSCRMWARSKSTPRSASRSMFGVLTVVFP